MMKKIERDFITANLATVEGLIREMTPSDFVTRYGLESRRDELKAELDTLEAVDTPEASSALFFGGAPVMGSRGIRSDFGASAIARYQDLVSKVHAIRELGNLGERGVVPARELSKLQITGVVHGSFGFQFEELPEQLTMSDTRLKETVDQVSKLMIAFDEVDDDAFTAAVADVDDRVVAAVRDFFEFVRTGDATFRIVSGEIDKSFDQSSIARAIERARITSVREDDVTFSGSLNGVLPENRDFEYRTATERGVIKGKIARLIPDAEVAMMNRDWTAKPSIITVHVKQVIRQSAVRRETFSLTKIEPAVA